VDESLRPNLSILAGAGAVIVLLSVLMLPWQAAVASAVLGSLMIAGADVDARRRTEKAFREPDSSFSSNRR